METMLFILAVLVLCYWLLRPHRYWTQKGVKDSSPIFILGDMWRIYMRRQSFVHALQHVYDMFPNTRYSGFYEFMTPNLMIKDPDLIKQITIKDFDHFVDHRSFVSEDVDPIWANNLLSLTGKKWREMRVTLSPTFTSSKMKYMFSLISQSGEQFAKHFLNKEQKIVTVEMKDALRRFTNDVIANTAFGIECDSLADRNNEFFLMGSEVVNFGGLKQLLKLFINFLSPKLCKLLKISPFSEKATAFFYKVINENIESREKHGIVRPDMINLLLQTRKSGTDYEPTQSTTDEGFATVEEFEITNKNDKKRELTNQDITSQAVIFFTAGFEVVSTLMCFMTYELAANPDIQQRLIQEVDEAMEANEGKLTYETLVRMKYMDMVVSEALRKWPVVAQADRICTKPYTVEPKYPGEKPLRLEYNQVLFLPIFAIHRDPQYYSDPERFDPDRFNDENKGKINPYTYIPFGSGPRNCIGNRFALLETKTLFFHILTHFEIVPVEKTQIPLKISKKQIALTAEKGFWFGLRRRTKA